MKRVARAVVPEDTLSHVAQQIRQAEYDTGWSRTVTIGRIVLDSLFEGKPDIWERQGHSGAMSLRQLAERDDCPLKKSALAQTIGTYVVVLEDPAVRTCGHLSPSHVACTLPLERAARRKVLREAVENRLSVRALAERVRAIRDCCQPAKQASSDVVEQVISSCSKAHALLRMGRLTAQQATGLRPKTSRSILEKLAGIEEEIELLRDALSKHNVTQLALSELPANGQHDLSPAKGRLRQVSAG